MGDRATNLISEVGLDERLGIAVELSGKRLEEARQLCLEEAVLRGIRAQLGGVELTSLQRR